MNKVFKILLGVVILAAFVGFPASSQTTDKKGPKAIPPEYTVLAIYSVEARGVSQEVADGLTPHLVFVINKHRGKVQVVQNEAVEKALEQVGLAASGACTDTVCLPELGKILGANRFLVSSITKLGERYTIYMTVFDAETGIEVLSDIEKCKCPEDELGDALERLTIRVMASLNGKKIEEPPKHKPKQPELQPQGPAMIQGNLKSSILVVDRYNDIEFSRDGRIIAAGGRYKNIEIFDTLLGSNLRTLEGHKYSLDAVRSISFNLEGKILASGGSDQTIRLWDVDTGSEVRILNGHTGAVSTVMFSPDGRLLASGSFDKTIKLWDVNSYKELRTLKKHKKNVNSIAFNPDGKILASGSKDKTIILWDIDTGKELKTLEGHKKSINSVTFSPDGKLLASGSNDKTIKLWDVATGKELRSMSAGTRIPIRVWSVEFSPDGRTLASANIETAVLWEVDTGNKLITLSTPSKSGIASVAFSPDGRILALGCLDAIWLYE